MGAIVRALIQGSPQLSSTAPAQTTIGNTAALVLAANPKRKGMIIQNTGTTILRFVLGTADPTQTVYHIALKAASVADDGSGGVYFDDAWVGMVRGISSAGGGTYVLTELQSGSPDWDLACDLGQEARF